MFLWIKALLYAIKLFRVMQVARNEMYKRTGVYEEMEVSIDDEVVLRWEAGKKWPSRINKQ